MKAVFLKREMVRRGRNLFSKRNVVGEEGRFPKIASNANVEEVVCLELKCKVLCLKKGILGRRPFKKESDKGKKPIKKRRSYSSYLFGILRGLSILFWDPHFSRSLQTKIDMRAWPPVQSGSWNRKANPYPCSQLV